MRTFRNVAFARNDSDHGQLVPLATLSVLEICEKGEPDIQRRRHAQGGKAVAFNALHGNACSAESHGYHEERRV